MIFWLFLFGLIAGSFLNVVAVRYDPEKFILSPRVIGGRSRCPHCGRTLSFFELVPLLSFLAQAGRCRKCRAKISPQYPLMEILCGLVFIFVPYAISKLSYAFGFHLAPWLFLSLSALWILALLTLLVVAVIDIRLRLIPDEANIFLAVLGIIFIALKALGAEGGTGGSFVGSYALLFGFQENVYVNHGIALLFGAVFFGFLIAITRGRGMGMGDLKLATALGVLFESPASAVIGPRPAADALPTADVEPPRPLQVIRARFMCQPEFLPGKRRQLNHSQEFGVAFTQHTEERHHVLVGVVVDLARGWRFGEHHARRAAERLDVAFMLWEKTDDPRREAELAAVVAECGSG